MSLEVGNSMEGGSGTSSAEKGHNTQDFNVVSHDVVSHKARMKIDELLERPEYYRYALGIMSISEARQYRKEFSKKYGIHQNK